MSKRASRKTIGGMRKLPDNDDSQATEDEQPVDWVKSMRTSLAQSLIMYLTTAQLSPEN